MKYRLASGVEVGFEDLPRGAMARLRVAELVLYKTTLIVEDLAVIAATQNRQGRPDPGVLVVTAQNFVRTNVAPLLRELLDAQGVEDQSRIAMGARYSGFQSAQSDLAKLTAVMKIQDKGGTGSYESRD